jgi:ketosteroid isomerase-like protein
MSSDSLLDSFYAAIKAADTNAVAACVHPDFTLNWQGTAAIPWAGVWSGADGLMKFFGILNRHVEVLEVKRLQALHDGSTTMVLLQGHWRMRANGAEVKALAANVFTFEEGKIRSYTVLNNTAAFSEALTS